MDLATAECPVDLSRLVTVTKLATTLESEPLGSRRSETVKRTTKKLSVKNEAPRGPNASGGGFPAKELSLMENLELYTEAVLKRVSYSQFYLDVGFWTSNKIAPSSSYFLILQ